MIFADARAARILVVDDDPNFTKLLTTFLQMDGYNNVRSTNDPAEAVTLYTSSPPDLVLLDISMPGMTGLDILELLRPRSGQVWTPFLVISGETDPDILVRALNFGAVDFIRKPFNRAEVLVRVRNALELARLYKAAHSENTSLQEQVMERSRELHEANLDALRRLARCAEYRDDESGNHIIRVGSFAEHVALASGIDPARSSLLRDAAALHDIGKIGIPDAVLLKRGKLDPDEWEMMKTHTLLGASLLSGSSSLVVQMAEQIALHHHERWDGSGYPIGLNGDAIPLEARVTALCDVFDALTSHRPHRQPWPPDQAFDEIAAQAEKQFDPALVAVFLQERREILRIRDRFPSPPPPAA
ncbi:MAG: response regulator [Candidatus Brocadiae bacterium]|nr:response regulator [Candidatus Brocadiia bacterium]